MNQPTTNLNPTTLTQIAPGIWRLVIGTPEAITPMSLRSETPRTTALAALPTVSEAPFQVGEVKVRQLARGLVIDLPVRGAEENFYGLGLQMSRLNQTGRKRTLRVNSDPVGDAGDSHAPVPFLVSTAGYGLLVDTARYATFYVASSVRVENTSADATTRPTTIASNTDDLYAARKISTRTITIDIPGVSGTSLYLLAGPSMLNVVQRYNLLGGGGCLPPMWGLGVWYRLAGKATQADVRKMADYFRTNELPCDVLGLEPGWQTHAYSCSFKWEHSRFPDPDTLVSELRKGGFHVNLWQHVFTHPTSPMYAALRPHAGDHQVWGGLVPDLTVPAARQVFSDYHHTHFINHGVTGFKLDECDNSDFISGSSWSFPEASVFPSGLDGEQMHTLLGLLYQRTIQAAFEDANLRTYCSVRSSGAMASRLPFVLYSDLYDHRDFLRGIPTSSFSGLLWSPEVRHALSREDLLRRIQSVVLSPQALINGWYINNPPWLQFDRGKNNAGELLEDAKELEEKVRKLLRFRMALLPYLYAAFARYYEEGIPPFRAVVMDYPADPQTRNIDDAYLIGPDLLAAPFIAGQLERKIYLPAGVWYDFNTRERCEGGKTHTRKAADFTDNDRWPLFAREGAIIPLASELPHTRPETVFDLTLTTYGPKEGLRPLMLFEDDTLTYNYRKGESTWLTIHPDHTESRKGNYTAPRYRVVRWVDD